MDVVVSKTGSKLVACVALAAAAASTAAADARQAPKTEIHAFRPEADTYVSAAAPRTNFGRRRTLLADGSPETTVYLRFRIGQLKGEITGVTLLLQARAGARTSFQVRRVYEDRWRERRLTYQNAPRRSLRYASSKPVRRGAWSAIDVSAFVDAENQPVSLAITTRSARGVIFASRESNHAPRLVVRTERKSGEGKPSGP